MIEDEIPSPRHPPHPPIQPQPWIVNKEDPEIGFNLHIFDSKAVKVTSEKDSKTAVQVYIHSSYVPSPLHNYTDTKTLKPGQEFVFRIPSGESPYCIWNALKITRLSDNDEAASGKFGNYIP